MRVEDDQTPSHGSVPRNYRPVGFELYWGFYVLGVILSLVLACELYRTVNHGGRLPRTAFSGNTLLWSPLVFPAAWLLFVALAAVIGLLANIAAGERLQGSLAKMLVQLLIATALCLPPVLGVWIFLKPSA